MIAIAILPLLLMCAWQRADTVAAMTREERRPVEPKAEADHRAVLEIGGAAAWSVTERSASGGGTLAMEITPIEHWLELEGGITILGAGRQRELSIDLLLKKPWQLTPTVEFMAGIGPEFSRKLGRDENGTRLGAEIVLDFMFWMGPTVGWYVEPSVGFAPGRNSERTAGMTAGLLIGFR